MKLGEVIRRYRKEKQITQEAMADYLGVSAPAVNKWERGVSYPDVTLLAPIARLLGITTDQLLSFKEELTDQEIGLIMKQFGEKVKSEEFHAVFDWAMGIVNEYPNCERLALQIGQAVDSYRHIVHAPNPEQYDKAVYMLYERVLDSQDPDVTQAALTALFCLCLSNKEFEKAQRYLDRMPKKRGNPNSLQAALYAKQGKSLEAYELCERQLLSGHGELSWALQGLCSLALQEGDDRRAAALVEKQKELAKVLELGSYMEALPGFELALRAKDREASLDILEDIVHGMGELPPCGASELYRHIKRGPAKEGNIAFMLKKGLEDDEEIGFLKGEERFHALMRELGEKSKQE